MSTLPQAISPWLAMLGFGAYHGLNPGMGWLFALSLGLQQRSERAIWAALLPIVLGHTASLAVVAVVILASAQIVSAATLQWVTALVLIAFGGYKVRNYYRHPRWVGMKVNRRDLTWWSFLMATAHGAGLMIAPTLVGMARASQRPGAEVAHAAHAPSMASAAQAGLLSPSADMALAVGLHAVAMLAVMTVVAWVVYKKVGLMILRRSWINFDLIWAVALLVVGGIALVSAMLQGWPS